MLKANAIGFDEVARNLKMTEKEINQRIQDELVRSGYNVINDAKNTLRKDGKQVTGVLVNSAKVLTQPGNVKAEFAANYASVVEFGRRAGKWPPQQPLEDWVKKRGFASNPKEIKQIAFLIARKITKKGIKKSPFLYPAFEREVIKLKTRLKGIVR